MRVGKRRRVTRGRREDFRCMVNGLVDTFVLLLVLRWDRSSQDVV